MLVIPLPIAFWWIVFWALDNARTDALAELRGVLLQELEWRQREGLV